MVSRALKAGFEALVLTVDCPVLGQRQRDLHNGFTVPLRPSLRLLWDVCRCPRWTAHIARYGVPKMQNLIDGEHTNASMASLASLMTRNLDASANWRDVDMLRALWPKKLVIKGVLSPEDAVLAVERGFDAIAVSNHGGRQLDFAPSSISVLAEVAAAVAGRAELYLDGGVRRGSDIAKAVALGARAVLLGRATLFGVAANGEQGVHEALAILGNELDRCLALIGCRSVAELNARYVRVART